MTNTVDIAQLATIIGIIGGLVVLLTPMLSAAAVWAVMKYRLGQQEKQTSANTTLIDTVATHVGLIDSRLTKLEEQHKGIEGSASATREDLDAVERKVDKISNDVAFLRGAAEGEQRGRRASDH
jgi:septal ring factor EnvC (AmiA/AmiB activator)